MSVDRERLDLPSQHLRFPLLRPNFISILLHALILTGHDLFMPTHAWETHRMFALNNSDALALPR